MKKIYKYLVSMLGTPANAKQSGRRLYFWFLGRIKKSNLWLKLMMFVSLAHQEL